MGQTKFETVGSDVCRLVFCGLGVWPANGFSLCGMTCKLYGYNRRVIAEM